MFKSIMQRLRDMKTIKNLCLEAEKIANIDGHKQPGAEHFVLSALALPDGTARKAFARISANPDQYHFAITQQYEDALRNVGIELPNDVAVNNAPPIPTSAGLYKTQPSAQALMHTLTREIMVKYQKENSTAPLLGAHVILAACAAQYGVATRAFRTMDIDMSKLVEAAKMEIIARQTP